MSILKSLSALVVVSALNGCTIARLYSTSGNEVVLTDVANQSGEAFKIDHRISFDYTSAVDIQDVLRERYGSGHKFENVSVKLKVNPEDFFINLFTFGIAQSKTFEISGDRIGRSSQ
jgi:hypothetical protein